LVRVSTDKQRTARQHDALQKAGCIKVFEEKASGKLKLADRPELQAAVDYLREGDLLCVQEADRFGRNLIDGLIVLEDLFSRGIPVKILEGIAAGEHIERSFVLDMAFAIAEDRRRDIVRKTKDGLAAAAARGKKGGRKKVMSEAMVIQAVALREQGFTIRQIQPHLHYKTADGKTRSPAIGIISEALQAHDRKKAAEAEASDASA
uniref:recombinase family protein n=1 Tax=Glycomyces sp. MUSA5-2 TaxID=2053002 RepID=UPI00300845FD